MPQNQGAIVRLSAIEKFKSSARLERLDTLISEMKLIPTGSLPQLSEQTIQLLLIVRKIERLVMVTYADEVKKMSSWNIPSIQEFSLAWEYEETRHAVALEEFARIHGYIMPQLNKESLGWKYRFKASVIGKLSHLFPRTGPAVHMIAGTINEVTAKNIYRLLAVYASNDKLLQDIVNAIEIEEIRHFNFYKNMAKELINNDKLRARVCLAVDMLWEPVGSGNGDVGILARVLLAKDHIAEDFFKRVKKQLETISDIVPTVADRVISDIKKLRTV